MSAVNSNTVGTALVQYLGGPAWTVAFIPLAQPIGFCLGPLLSAHLVDRKDRFLPVLRAVLPWSRLPLLATALVLWFAGPGALALWIVLLANVVYGLMAGLAVTAWQQLVGKTVAAEARPSLLAIRYLASNVLGVGAGLAVAAVLVRHPGTRGYALLYLLAFTGTVASFSALMGIREGAVPPHPGNNQGIWSSLMGGAAAFSADARLGWLLVTTLLLSSQHVMVGFMALHARDALGQGEAYIGTLTASQVLGGGCGTLFAALLGRRLRAVQFVVAARWLMLGAAAGMLVADSDWAFRLLFACYGASLWVNLVGQNSLALELLPPGNRSAILAVFGAVQVPCMLLASQFGAALWGARADFRWLAAVSAFGLLAALWAAYRLRARVQAATAGREGASLQYPRSRSS